MKRNFNRTKIIATVGPASQSEVKLKRLIKAGVDVVRINFSHGSYHEYAEVIKTVAKLNEELGLNVGIMADLQGPKIRIGEIKDGVIVLREKQEIMLTTKPCIGDIKCLYINYEKFPRDVSPGERILLDDGKLELKVIYTNKKDKVKAKVIYGGKLSSNKGVNLPNTGISMPCLTDKDLKDLQFALKHDVNWIALSFVRSAGDIKELKKIIAKRKKASRVIAKIEKPQALRDIDNIIEETDAVMIARGDLGVEVPIEQIPGIQKTLIKKSIRASKPVIIATQVMENMINHPTPTRAEITDVANTVYDGADALMLSGETSVGKYPVKVIETISKVIDSIEDNEEIYMDVEGKNKWNNYPDPKSKSFIADAVCYNAATLSVKVQARAMICMTMSGYTAFKTTSYRARTKTFVFTENRFLLNTLSLVWGARGLFYNKFISTDGTIRDVINILKKEGYLRKGDVAINTASMPLGEKGTTNMLKVSVVE